jgi:hypothetical protein
MPTLLGEGSIPMSHVRKQLALVLACLAMAASAASAGARPPKVLRFAREVAKAKDPGLHLIAPEPGHYLSSIVRRDAPVTLEVPKWTTVSGRADRGFRHIIVAGPSRRVRTVSLPPGSYFVRRFGGRSTVSVHETFW